MNWEAMSAIGEIVDSLPVLITLAFVKLQVLEGKQATADQNGPRATDPTN